MLKDIHTSQKVKGLTPPNGTGNVPPSNRITRRVSVANNRPCNVSKSSPACCVLCGARKGGERGRNASESCRVVAPRFDKEEGGQTMGEGRTTKNACVVVTPSKAAIKNFMLAVCLMCGWSFCLCFCGGGREGGSEENSVTASPVCRLLLFPPINSGGTRIPISTPTNHLAPSTYHKDTCS